MTTARTLGSPARIAADVTRIVVAAVREASKRRTRRLALAEIMRMDARRIEDLGILAQDVVEALAPPQISPRRSGQYHGTRVAPATGAIACTC